MKKTLRKVLPVLALVLVVAVASVGGTIAWLTDKTDAVTNTFTVGDINIKLYETLNPNGVPNTDGSNVTNWQAKLIPGSKYAKNPLVSVDVGSEDCYLFVKFDEVNSPATYLDYMSNLTQENGWTKLTGEDITDNIWYREVKTTDETRSWYLLKGEILNDDETNTAYVHGKVTVKDTVTKDTMPTAENAPKLQYTAYAIQQANTGTAAEAWAKLQASDSSTSEGGATEILPQGEGTVETDESGSIIAD